MKRWLRKINLSINSDSCISYYSLYSCGVDLSNRVLSPFLTSIACYSFRQMASVAKSRLIHQTFCNICNKTMTIIENVVRYILLCDGQAFHSAKPNTIYWLVGLS